MFDNKQFAFDLIYKRRIELDVSMDDACIEIGISKPTLSRIERGKKPDIDTFAKVCKWLKEDPNKYLNEKEK